jgi:nitrate reductase gamma subunit
MFLEIVTFRSLFRNTKSEIHDGPKITYESSKWLWVFALIFHYSFFSIVVRHLRLFLDPVPFWIGWWEFIDGIFEVGAPGWYISDVGLVVGCLLLFSRRLITRHIRYISLMNDYFPLVLIFAIAVSGILMRYFLRTDIDIVNIKQLTVGLVSLSPTIGAKIGPIFFIHVFLVCVLLAYFPFSKLMHFAGVFLSPTRNLKNNSRAVRHENPWNPRILPHSYAGYEDEFREFMVDAGIPVEKELSPAKDE